LEVAETAAQDNTAQDKVEKMAKLIPAVAVAAQLIIYQSAELAVQESLL
jgi:hypothetical protein